MRRTVALKEIRPELTTDPLLRRRFLAEAEITGRLEHPGIVPIYALEFDSEGHPVYAMRFIEGQTLAQAIAAHLAQPTMLRLRELLQSFVAVCQTMAYAHSQGVIHRDLKPSNVMLGGYGETLVVDWGLAKPLPPGAVPSQGGASGKPISVPADLLESATLAYPNENPSGEGQMTSAGTVLGTPAYMAPEQARGEALGPAADIYALGAILREILTGRPPYEGVFAAAVLRNVLAGPPPPLEAFGLSIPRPLLAICNMAMARQPFDRYLTAGALAQDVERWLADEPVLACPELWYERLGRWARRHQTLVVTLCVAGLLILVGLVGLSWLLQEKALAEAIHARDTEARQLRNAESVANLLDQAEEALSADDRERAVVAIEAARQRAAEGGTVPLEARLARCRRDLEVLHGIQEFEAFQWGYYRDEPEPPGAASGKAHDLVSQFGIEIGVTSPAEAAHLLRSSPLQEQMLSVLDRWLIIKPQPALRALLAEADPNPTRERWREAVMRSDAYEAARVAESPEAMDQPVRFLILLGANQAVPPARYRQLLLAGLQRRPGDLGLLMALGHSMDDNKPEDRYHRLRWYQAAVAAHPNRPGPHENLAMTLMTLNDFEGAIASHRSALRCDPTNGFVHLNLGTSLFRKGDLEGAIEVFRQAVRHNPTKPKYPSHLGYFLARYKKDYPAATESLQAALRLKPDFDQALGGMGLMFEMQENYAEAAQWYRKSIESSPNYEFGRHHLAYVLELQGDVDGSLREYRELSRRSPGNASFKGTVARLERWHTLLPRLHEFVTGRAQPAFPAEALECAALCASPGQKAYGTAVRLFAWAFAKDAKLAENLQLGHRYDGAVAAVTAGCGPTKDEGGKGVDRNAMRQQALLWLRADLTLRQAQAASPIAGEKAKAVNALATWLNAPAFARVRPGSFLEEMNEEERAQWSRFWTEVQKTEKQARPERTK